MMNKPFKLALLLLTSLSVPACSYVPEVPSVTANLPSWMGGDKKEKPKEAGERISILPVDAGLKPDPALKDIEIKLPAVTKNTEWAAHSGMFPSDASNLAGGTFDSETSTTIGDGNNFELNQLITPVVGVNTVFAMDALGFISAHDADDIGKLKWKGTGVSEESEVPVIGGGLAFNDGKLYAISGHGKAAAFDAATGKELWNKNLHVPFRSAPKISGGKLYATTIDNQLYVLNIADGEVAWTQRGISETTNLMNTVSPAVTSDAVVVPYSSGEVYVLSNDGREIWSDSLSGKRLQGISLFSGIGGDPVIDNSVVFLASSGGLLQVRSIATGQPAWEAPIGTTNTPWVSGEYLFLLTSENTLLALHKFDGHIRWSTKLTSYGDEKKKKEPITWKGPVMIDGKLAVAGSNGQLLLVNALDGMVTATKPIPEGIYTPPVVANGKIYLVGKDATLYMLK